MEFTNVHLVATLGCVIGVIFGLIAAKTNFCTMGGISDWVNMGLKGRFGAWLLAMGVAVAGTQILELTGLVDIPSSIYRTSALGLGGYIVGGLMFGVGMTLSGGCGQRTLVRVGGGNLKSLIVFLVLALTAYMTLRGILAIPRTTLIEPLSLDISGGDQGLTHLLGGLGGSEASTVVRAVIAFLIAAILIGVAMKIEGVRADRDNLIAGIAIGLLVVAAWFVTGFIGQDDFDPVPVEGMSFVAPTGNSISYLMTYTGSTINFGIALVFGIIAGSFLYAVVSRTFRIETFSQKGDMIGHLVGASLMGIGGILALGCTVGQGVSGISTLAAGSFIAVFCIMIGSAITLRTQYHRMDEQGIFASCGLGIADILIPWRKLD